MKYVFNWTHAKLTNNILSFTVFKITLIKSLIKCPVEATSVILVTIYQYYIIIEFIMSEPGDYILPVYSHFNINTSWL